jgi:hypothetical protein
MPADGPGQALLAGRHGRQVVTALGVTGHQVIPSGAREMVVGAIRAILSEADGPLSARTSLAAGADQLFATELLRTGGRLHVIVPSRNYEQTFTADEDLALYRSLLQAADTITRLEFDEPSEAAFLAAGKVVVDNSETLVAVWDGEPARGPGGTADVVGYAREMGKAVIIVWPDGMGR